MKRKFLLSITSAVLGAIFILTAVACGCTPTTTLSFKSAWSGENTSFGYTETAVYEVKHVTDFVENDYNYKVDEKIKEVIEFSNGVYTTTTRNIPSTDLPSEYDDYKENDILKNYDGGFIHHKTKLSIDVTIKSQSAEVADVVNHDTIEVDSYFCDSKGAYTPLYSIQKNKFSSITPSNEGISIAQSRYNIETIFFSKSLYNVKMTALDENGVAIVKEGNPTTYANYYSFKQTLDNTQFLFTIRNAQITDDATSFTLPTVSPTHKGSVQNLKLSRYATATIDMTIDVNGTPTTVQMPVNKCTFMLSATNSGSPQFVYLQSKEAANLANTALLVKYVEPIFTHGTFSKLGVLEYTLKSVTNGVA